ncbi:hypothetical protein STEG23_017197 [Scotinomys teguina]
MVTSSMAGWRLLLCFLALDSSSSFPCPAFLAIAKSNVVFLLSNAFEERLLQRFLQAGPVVCEVVNFHTRMGSQMFCLYLSTMDAVFMEARRRHQIP